MIINNQGIYKDKDKAKNTRLEKTILLNVIETSDDYSDKYNNYLKNLLCYTKHYNYESIVYIIGFLYYKRYKIN
jgi:trehalose-6-phosphate synthase